MLKRQTVYLYQGDRNYRSATFGYLASSGTGNRNREYRPTKASAWRLAKTMERILDSKQFNWTLVTPQSLTIRLLN